MRKFFVIFLIFLFLFVSVSRAANARSEAGNALAAVATIGFLFVMGKWIFPYYGQNTVNVRFWLDGRNYAWPNASVSMQEICIEEIALPKGPPWDPWSSVGWRCIDTVRIRKYKDSDRKTVRIGGEIFEFERYKFKNLPLSIKPCLRRKLRLEIGQFGTLYGWWECVE